MKLYESEARNTFVFAVVGSNAKEGTAPEYKCAPGTDIESAFQRNLGGKYRMAAPYCMGRYDDLGRYMTYCPPVDGVRPGKFVMHPIAEQEHKASRGY